MSWDRVQWCELGGLRLVVSAVRQDRSRDQVAYGYPGQDGAEWEDQGRAPVRVSVDVELHDFDGATAQDRWEDLNALFEEAGTYTYVDPLLGQIDAVRIAACRPQYSESPDHIRVELDLVEERAQEGFAAETMTAAAAAARIDAALAAASEALGAL